MSLKKFLFSITFIPLFLFLVIPVFAEDSLGFTFPDLAPGSTSLTFTYHNLTSSPVGVVGLDTPGIKWAIISSPSCSTSHMYNDGTNPAVEGCNLAPGDSLTITAIAATHLSSEPSDLSFTAASYDTNSGFSTGQYNLLSGYDYGTYVWNPSITPIPTITPSPAPTPVGTEDNYGFAFSPLIPPVTSYTFTYHNLTSSPIGVVGLSNSIIVWSSIYSPSCNTYYLYNFGTNPAVEGCNLAPGDTMTIVATPFKPITTEPSDLSFTTASYDTNSGYATGHYNLLSGYDYGTFVWNAGTPPQNYPPSVGSITVTPNPLQINSSITASASFIDANSSDTHTVVWNWGDGTTSNGTATESNGSGSVTGSHTYTAAGVYTISLTVTDNQGASNTSTFQYVSVYNPTSQGLFSAGQRYMSPAGAYIANTSLTGTVKFGLSYKYQGTVPTGDKQFTINFNATNFIFNATSVTSLVTSNNIGTLRGTGTVNGSGTYTFLVSGNGNANTIRIQIKDQSGNVIYDTQPGTADTATPATSVTGNVIVH